MPDLNAPYRGWKATFFEGGIRTPLLMRWPGHIAPGSMRGDLTGHIDLFATIAAAAGAKLPTDRVMDSQNILAGPATRDTLYGRSGDYPAVRAGDWKMQGTKHPEKAKSEARRVGHSCGRPVSSQWTSAYEKKKTR